MGKHEADDESLLDHVKGALGLGGDQKDWDVTKHGRMVDHATGPEGEPPTTPWEG